MTGVEAEQLRQQAYSAYQQGDVSTAVVLCDRIVARFPDHVQAIYLQGAIALEKKQFAAALGYLGKAVLLAPSQAVYLNALGEAWVAQGDKEKGISFFERAIAAQPAYARAHNNLGMEWFTRRRVPEAIACFERAVGINPQYATALNNLGAACQFTGRHDLAERQFKLALAARPKYPEASFNLATALHARGDYAGASIQLRSALEQRPDYAKAVALLGRVNADMGKVEAAIGLLGRAVELDPKDGISWLILGNLQRLMNRPDEARVGYLRALEINPSDPYALAGQLRMKDELCDWSNRSTDLPALMEMTLRAVDAGQSSPVAALHATALPFSAADIFKIAASQARPFERRAPSGRRAVPYPAGGRIRVGYMSRDFYDHPVGHQIAGLFPLHDRSRFEIHVYSFGPNDSSIYRRSIQQNCECFHDVADLTSEQLTQRIGMDGIDILVDLMGHTGMSRVDCLAMRPAPLLVTWLGYPGTLGARFIDYLIADPAVVPMGSEVNYSEKIIRMPGSFMITDAKQHISPAAVSRADEKLPEGAVVLAVFNNAFKIEPVIFELWMEICRACPDSVLWSNVSNAEARSHLRSEAAARGVDGERLIFASHVADKSAHLARLRLADVFLDAHFYNAHATACDWLWAGVPVVTWPGETFAARVGASLLRSVGLPELVAGSDRDYVARAIQLARSPDERERLRARLNRESRTSLLFNTPGFVAALEKAFTAIHARHTSGLEPAHLMVETGVFA